MSESKPPVEYLAQCSKPSLESFELARLNQIANLRKELREVVDAWIEAEVEARLARWILEQRRAQEQTLIPFLERRAESPPSAPARKSPLRAPPRPAQKKSNVG